MVQLVPMTEAEFAVFAERTIAEYAQDKARLGDWHPDEALAKSQADFAHYVPNGLQTPNAHFFIIRDEMTSESVGELWITVNREGYQPSAFILEIAIYPACRRRGYATQTFATLETLLKGMGIHKLGLHVFAHNPGAKELYEKVGFHVTGYQMVKRLDT